MGIENKVILVEQGKIGKRLIDSWRRMRLLYCISDSKLVSLL